MPLPLRASHEVLIRARGHLYDDAQTSAEAMNYIKSRAKQTWPERDPRQWRCALPDLDAAARVRWRVEGKAPAVRRRWVAPANPRNWGSIYVQLAASDASYATGQVYGATEQRQPYVRAAARCPSKRRYAALRHT